MLIPTSCLFALEEATSLHPTLQNNMHVKLIGYSKLLIIVACPVRFSAVVQYVTPSHRRL